MHDAILFKKLEDDKVKCTACNNYCIIKSGDSGICSIRKNVCGKLKLMVYGQAAAMNIDPIEKKPLYHFLPGQKIFSIGTVGCNFGCEFCQNWDLSQAIKHAKQKKENDVVNRFLEYGYDLPPKRIIEECEERGINTVAFTYNEPVIFFEYAFDTMKLAKKKGIKTVFVSNGYESKEALTKMKKYLDAINIDLKSFNPVFYKKICHAKLQPVLETIKKCHDLGIWVEITTLIIPGENDSEEELKKIVDFIASVDINIPWHISAFHPQYNMKHKSSTEHSSLIQAYEMGKKKLNHVYVGNVRDPKRSATYCPKCNNILIKREFNSTNILRMKKNKCLNCDEEIKGVF